MQKIKESVCNKKEKTADNLWNIALDLRINAMLIKNGVAMPKGAFIPTNDQYVMGQITIDRISERSAEEIYNLMVKAEDKLA